MTTTLCLQCTDLLEHLSETCSTASQHRQILLDITRLSSTKLRSRDDAENLLSSRVPIQSTSHSNNTKSTSVEPAPYVNAESAVKAETSAPIKPIDQSASTTQANVSSTSNVQPVSSMAPASASMQTNMVPQNNGSQMPMAPTFTYPQMPVQVDGIASYNNPFMTGQAQPSSFLTNSNAFNPTFDFSNNAMSMPFSSNPSTNQADLAFWREMPIGEDAGEWGFFTDQYANTLLSSLPTFSDSYTSQM